MIATTFEMPTLNLAKVVSFLCGLGLTNEQLKVMIDTLSIDQCRELGEALNVFEYLDFGLIDEPGEADHGELFVSITLADDVLGPSPDEEMARYPEEGSTEKPRFVGISEIIVPDEYSKEQLIMALKYIHDIRQLDTDILAINTLAHLHLVPDRITVNEYHNSK